MQISLVILAAGLGSRFENGSKQTAQVGPNGEMILEYSIHDAIEAGFDKIVFVIREDMEEIFKNMISNIYHDSIDIDYVFQKIEDIPCPINYKRIKPWGTAHALYSLRNSITTSFAVINADDYYGKDAFIKMYKFLNNECDDETYAMVGYPLRNTLSENGSVNRGICNIKDSRLLSIKEVFNIYLENDMVKNEQNMDISIDSICSMGFYGFPANIFASLEEMLEKFLESSTEKDEFIIPAFIEKKLQDGCVIKVLNSSDRWIGVTYSEDLLLAKKYFLQLKKNGVYQNKF